MRHPIVFMRGVAAISLLLLCVSTAVLAAAPQSSTSSLSGLVVDRDGGVMPGVTVVATHDATGVSTTTVTNSAGVFSMPALGVGTYTVTISLSGFKNSVLTGIRLITSNPADLGKVTMEVGAVEETIEVSALSSLVQTQSVSVASTVSGEQLRELPMASRNVGYALWALPGVETTGGNARNTVISGLPQEVINITLDGVNINDNRDKAGNGFQGMVRPTLDAIEEVTLTQAADGADSAGQGAVQIRFTTRSGTNAFRGTVYEYFRHESLNTNYFFNELRGLPKSRNTLNQTGGSIGGPILRNKAFFFVNIERLQYDPQSINNRTVLNPESAAGLFRYSVTASGAPSVREVNLFALAAANGQTATHDPTVTRLLTSIRGSIQTTGTLTNHPTDPNLLAYSYVSLGAKREYYPTTKIDFNLHTNHRLSATIITQSTRDEAFGGQFVQFPGLAENTHLKTERRAYSGTLRSTLASNIVNELVIGAQNPPLHFNRGLSADKFDDQGGFALTFGAGLTNYATTSTRNDDRALNFAFSDSVSLQKGNHGLRFGAAFDQIDYSNDQYSFVPSVTFGVQSSLDPADAMFSTAAFPGASTTDLANARAIYALLTGRVTGINANSRLNEEGSEYRYLGTLTDRTRMRQFGLFVQDAWRVTPGTTLNLGLRWDYQTPLSALVGSYSSATFADLCGVSGVGAGPQGRGCNIFSPGTLTGQRPTYQEVAPSDSLYKKDWDNAAPSVGVAWRPGASRGFWRALLGDPDQATVRAGYSLSYTRGAMADLTAILSGNPGRSISANRSAANGNLVLQGESWPLLYRDATRLGPPATCGATVSAACVPAGPSYPLAMTTANNVSIFDPSLDLSYADSYSVGLQRPVGRNWVVEMRYVGSRNHGGWATENWNETNIESNGFLEEFKLAMANLQSNIAAGRGNSFAYFGANTGTAPLPIILSHLVSGVTPAQAGDAARYTGANWTNSTLVGFLASQNPNPRNFVSSTSGLYGNTAFRANGRAAGFPSNLWVMNPDVNNATILTNVNRSRYDSLQLEARRRYANGFQFTGGYTYGIQRNTVFESLSRARYLAPGANVPHQFKVSGVLDIPFGDGRRFGSGAGAWLKAIAGGWTVSATGRYQWQSLVASGVRLVGMTHDELQDAYKIRIDESTQTVYIFPDDIVLNTRRAFNVSATSPNGYSALGAPEGRYLAPASFPGCVALYRGDCDSPDQIRLIAPLSAKTDLTVRKRITIAGSKNVEIQFDLLNLFGNVNFNPVFNPGAGSTVFQVTSGLTSATGTFEPGGQVGQLMVRFNW